MSDPRSNGEEDHEWSTFELNIARELNDRNIGNENFFTEHDEANGRKLFELFQNAAQCLTTLYKDTSNLPLDPNSPGYVPLWKTFQNAAAGLTAHHRACMESIRISNELAMEVGSQRKIREMVTWCSNRKKRHLRREDVLAWLGGKSPPHRRSPPPARISFRSSPRVHRTNLDIHHSRPRQRLMPSPLHHNGQQEQDLTIFREALFTGARKQNGEGLQVFFNEEYNRNKRPAPSPSPPISHSGDVTMDSPQHKRFKYT